MAYMECLGDEELEDLIPTLALIENCLSVSSSGNSAACFSIAR